MATNTNPIQYLRIDDFSPGIVGDSRVAGGTGLEVQFARKAGEASVLSFFQPSNGFNSSGTLGCIANQYGKLVPLPGGIVQYSIPITDTFIGAAGIAAAPVGNPISFIQLTVAGAPAHDTLKIYAGNGLIRTLTGLAVTPQNLRGVSHVWTRGRRSAFDSAGFGVLAYEWTSGEPHTDGSIMFYDVLPDPNNLSSNTPYEETGVINNAAFLLGGQLVAHSGRILRLCETTQAWTAAGNFLSNERVRYTDPPNSVSLTSTTTDSIVDSQYPGGYGAWGSLTFGELLLIKKYGGALLVEGDIYSPQITRLPGVQSTGFTTSEMAWSRQGLVYATDDGYYVWQGGDSAQRLPVPSAMVARVINVLSGVNYSMMPYNNWVVTTGGNVFDSVTGSWWKLLSPLTAGAMAYFTADVNGLSQFWAISDTPNAGGNLEVARFNNLSINAQQYSWQSQPLTPVPNQVYDIVSVELELSRVPTSGANSCTVSFVNMDRTLDPVIAFNITPSSRPRGYTRLRAPCGTHSDVIAPYIVMQSFNTLAAELDAIIIGYRLAQPPAQGY